MTWTTLAEEAALMDLLGDTERAEVDVVGSSVEGRPIRSMRLGAPPPAVGTRVSAMCTGLYHGNEPSGREALLRVASDFALPERWLELPGSSGAYASTPDHSSLDLDGDFGLRCDLISGRWGDSGSTEYLVSKYTTTGDQRSYALRIDSDGFPQLSIGTGTGALNHSSTVAPTPNPLTGRVSVWASYVADDGGGSRRINFWQSRQIGGGFSGPWTHLDEVVGAAAAPFQGSAVLEIGSHTEGTGGLWSGRVYAAQAINADGDVVAHPIFSEADGDTGTVTDAAGREWTIHGTASIEEPTVPELPTSGLVLVPTVNPDGFAAEQRNNANGVDLNTTHVNLPTTTPETRAVSTVLQWAQPVALLDLHESTNVDPDDVQFAAASNPMTDSDVVNEAGDIVTALKARITAEGDTPGDWPAGDAVRTIRNSAGLRNTIAVLCETNRTDQTADGEAERAEWAWFVADEFLDYVVTNFSTLESAADDAATAQAARGAAGTDPFELYPGPTTLDPPPLAYRLSLAQMDTTTFHRTVWNVATDGDLVRMDQAMYGAIPYLLDDDAELSVVSGVRLLVLPTEAVFATVEEFGQVVSGSHDVVVEALVLTTFQSGGDPDGTDLPIIDGDVQFDATADVHATLSLTTVGVDETTGKSWFPRRGVDLLAPYGNEVYVRRGVDLGGDGILWSPLGYFRIESAEQDGPTSEEPIRLSGSDRMASIVEAKMVAPKEYPPETTFAAIFADLVGDVYPGAIVQFDGASAFAEVGRHLVVDESRYEPLREIADSLGKIMYWDGQGVLQVATAPDEGDIRWRVWAGRDGVLLTSARRVSRDGAVNAVIVYGEAAGDDDPVRGVAVDRGPNSPTRWRRPGEDSTALSFGQVPLVETLPEVTTRGQAEQAARELLRRSLGVPYSADFGAVVNPALRPWMPVQVRWPDGNRETHVMQQVTVPLTVGGEMSGATRERTHVVIGDRL